MKRKPDSKARLMDGDEVERLFFERNRYEEALRIIATGKRLRTMTNGKKKVMHYGSYDSLQGIARAALGYPDIRDEEV